MARLNGVSPACLWKCKHNNISSILSLYLGQKVTESNEKLFFIRGSGGWGFLLCWQISNFDHSQLPLNRYPKKWAPCKWKPRVGPCLSSHHLAGHLIGSDKKSQIVRYFQRRLCDKLRLLCDKLCDFFRANLHCFTRFQRRKTTLMLFNEQFECKRIIKHPFKTK